MGSSVSSDVYNNKISYYILQFMDGIYQDWGRICDVYTDGNYIIIHTHNGGNNRSYYKYVFEAAIQHPWFDHEENYDIDYAFIDIYFRVPNDRLDEFQNIINLSATK